VVQAVDAPLDPAGAVVVVLVAESVAEGLDRVGVGDDVAVAVEPAVDLPEREGSVAGQDLEAHLAQHGTGDGDGALGGRRDQRVAVVRGPAAPWPGDARVQGVAVEGELVEDVEALLGDLDHRLVDRPQPAQEVLALDVTAHALPW
jgi:hypothetical protein